MEEVMLIWRVLLNQTSIVTAGVKINLHIIITTIIITITIWDRQQLLLEVVLLVMRKY
jgi:hypothetical protein